MNNHQSSTALRVPPEPRRPRDGHHFSKLSTSDPTSVLYNAAALPPEVCSSMPVPDPKHRKPNRASGMPEVYCGQKRPMESAWDSALRSCCRYLEDDQAMEKESLPMIIDGSYQIDQKHNLHHGFNHESLWNTIRALVRDVCDPGEEKTEIGELDSRSIKKDKSYGFHSTTVGRSKRSCAENIKTRIKTLTF